MPLDNKYSEPKVEERPLVESRLVCPDGYEIKYLSTGTYSSRSGSLLAGTTATAEKIWSTQAKPDPKDAVCVDSSKPDAAKGSE